MTDPIADFLTRIRNAVKANHKVVEAPGSKIKQEITKILYEQGYILLTSSTPTNRATRPSRSRSSGMRRPNPTPSRICTA